MEWEWFRGEYANWPQAAAASGSYAATEILDRVRDATRRVRDGRADYERDGVAFVGGFRNEPLCRACAGATRPDGGLRVLDVGGALGSLYWQHRQALAAISQLEWRVVEQPHFVAAGRAEFETPALGFWPDLEQATAGCPPDLVVLSSVLQYVPEPWALLDAVLDLRAPWVLIDRLPLLASGPDRLTVEHVPPKVGAATYPAWFLAEPTLLARVQRSYRLRERFTTRLEDGVVEGWRVFGTTVENGGLLLRRD